MAKDDSEITTTVPIKPETVIGGGASGETREDPSERKAGSRVSRYRIVRTLGEGGMGVVYEAVNLDLQRVCALKLLKPQAVLNRDRQVEFFLREARSAAALDHPNIVTVYNVGEVEDTYFIEMEYLEGATLTQLVTTGGPLPVSEATSIIRQAADALGQAHRRGIVHRDIKPRNIILAKRNVPKLTDFGLAISVASASATEPRDMVAGTPQFMSPEQCEGRPCDARSDIYSLGATYFYCVTGQFPFTGPDCAAIVYQHLYRPPPSPRDVNPAVPESVAHIIRTTMAKDPDDRFESCVELIGNLNIVLSGRPAIAVILEEALRGLNARYREIGEGYEVTLTFAQGRSQRVRVILGRKDSEGHEIVTVYSKCAPSDAASFEWALKFNSRLPYGALALEEVDGEEALVILNTHLREALDPPELRKSILSLGEWADRLEEEFTGADVH